MAAPRSRLTVVLAFGIALSACADRTPTGVAPPEGGAAGAGAGEPRIPTRSEERPGTFIDLDDASLWALLEQSGGRAAIGLKAPGAVRGVWQGRVLVDRPQWRRARQAVLAQRGVRLVAADELLPIIDVDLADVDALRAVRRLPAVDYVEPVYVPDDLPDFAGVGGCGWGSTWGSDRLFTASGDLYSQKLTAMGIPAAWSLSSGAGITIGLTDTGLSSGQTQFFGRFTSGDSGGRWMSLHRVSSMPSVYDECGHGTRMAGIIAAPWDGQSVGGIAYRSNLVSVRQANGVASVSSSDARQSVRLAMQNGSQVVVMAWQSLNWWWQVSDEIRWWHNNRQVLFFGAAGTSGCWDGILDSNVVFPADMGEVVAVTGVNYPNGGIPCGVHYGKEVELTAYLEVPTTGQYAADVVGMGGSSNATAVTASVAALVWSRNPWMSRDQLRARLHQTAAYYPNRHSREGFGLIDAQRAVAGP
jgi:subtilisin family serine protease